MVSKRRAILKQKIITDNGTETITVKSDGERFGLVHKKRDKPASEVIILNYNEMRELIKFAEEELKKLCLT